MYDVIIIGGGPAGLSAALLLGRCQRKVLVCDDGKPRNARAIRMHNYLTRDGISPREFLARAREELSHYEVDFLSGWVANAACLRDPAFGTTAFEVGLSSGERFETRKLLLATGLRDILPEVEGVQEFYGRGLHHCPYCDGYEYRGKHLVAWGEESAAAASALGLITWSKHVTLCTDSHPLSDEDRATLVHAGVGIHERRIVALRGESSFEAIEFDDGSSLPCDAIFFSGRHVQRSALPRILGCSVKEKDEIRSSSNQTTSIPGVFVAGDCDGDVQFVIVAAAEGATAAVTINRALQKEDLSDMKGESLPRPELRWNESSPERARDAERKEGTDFGRHGSSHDAPASSERSE